MVVVRYYDEDVLNRLGLLDDICWLFSKGGVS